MTRYFDISIHDQTLVWHICVYANFSLMTNRVLRNATLPTTQIHFTFELSRIGGSHNYPFACVTNNGKVASVGVRVKTNDKLKIALFRIRSSLLSHIIACRLREVKPSNSNFTHLSILKVNARNLISLLKK
jgi:hypothetical protein